MLNPPPINEQDLKPGDVLLSASEGLLSSIILDLDHGIYTHAAYWDGSSIIEAEEAGVLKNTVANELHYHTYVDAYRFVSDAGETLKDAAPLTVAASAFLGHAYAQADAVLMALLIIGSDNRTYTQLELFALDALFEAATAALSKLVGEGKTPVICSELVYLAFENALPEQHYHLRLTDALGNSDVDGAAVESHGLGASFIATLSDRHPAPAASARTFVDAYRHHIGTPKGVVMPGLVTPTSLQYSPNLRLIGRLKKPV